MKMNKKLKSIVLASSKGIGKGIASNLKKISNELITCSSKDIDTSDIKSVKRFIKKHKNTDVLILNTGGPPPMEFSKITDEIWLKYFNQLFLSFSIILRDLKINKNGYIFLISSFHIRELNPKLILSNSLRVGFWSVLKSISYELSKKNISSVNIAPGPIDTDRFRNLNKNVPEVIKELPLGRLGRSDEIGKFIKSIIENDIKYINGTTIFFDGGKSSSLF
jgi:3-oxoacyl-[acyl-carrier protein] reductase